MKRLGFVLIMMLAVVALLVAGCGGGDGEEATPTATESPGATATQPPTETETPGATATATPAPTQPSGVLGDLLGKAGNIDSVKYDMVMTGPGVPSMTSKVWLKQKAQKMKMESTVQGETNIQIIDWAVEEIYMYMPSQNMAFRMDLSGAPGGAPESPLEGTETIEDYDYTIIGTEIYDGKECLVAEYTFEDTKTKMWIWKEHGFPVKVESTTPEGTMKIEYKNIDFSNIPNSEFELPPGVEIREMPS